MEEENSESLKGISENMDIFTGGARLTGLIGNPVEHSVSPQLHNILNSIYKHNTVYLPFRVLAQDLKTVLDEFRAVNILGFNVTIPYKSDVIPLLDRVSDEALLIGAVNTVKNINGELVGFNTDGEGFLRALKDKGIDVKGMTAMVIGAGGASRAVVVKLVQNGIEDIVILNRSLEKAQKISDFVNEKINCVCRYDYLTDENLLKYSRNSNLLINTTPVGMWPDVNSSPVSSSDVFVNKPIVYDLIYNPLKSRLLIMAERSGCKTLNGLGMLIHQGINAFEIWNELIVPENIINDISARIMEFFK